MFLICFNVTETDDDDRYINDDDDDGIFLMLLFFLHFMCLNFASFFYSLPLASLGDSVGYAVQLKTRRSRIQPPPRSATFFRGD